MVFAHFHIVMELFLHCDIKIMSCDFKCTNLTWCLISNVLVTHVTSCEKASSSVIIFYISASSTTSDTKPPTPHKLPSDPTDWTIDEVIQHITETDPALNTHVDLFRKHVSRPIICLLI